MTLPASGNLSLKDIYTEIYGSHTNQQVSLYSMAYATYKSTSNIKSSSFYGYSRVVINPTVLTFDWIGNACAGNTISITVPRNAYWTTNSPSYFNVSSTSGYGPSSISISTTSMNYGATSRLSILSVTYNSQSQTCVLDQAKQGGYCPP